MSIYDVSQICYSRGMEGNTGSALTSAIARILRARHEELGLSLRQLEDMSGVSRMTISRTLKGDNAVGIDSFMLIANALGLEAWKVYKQAEDQLRATPPVVSLDECRSQADAYINETQAKLARVLSRTDLTPAAKPHQPDPDANIGEENQDTGVQND